MENGFGLKLVSCLLVLFCTTMCVRRTAVLKYASARRVSVKEIHGPALLISGGTIHSGSCISRVEQQRNGSAVTLLVRLVPADGHCSGEFFSVVSLDGTLNTVKLGIPNSRDPSELGVIWQRSR